MRRHPVRSVFLALMLSAAFSAPPASGAEADRELSGIRLSITKLQAEMQAVQRTLYKNPSAVRPESAPAAGKIAGAEDAGFPDAGTPPASAVARLSMLEENIAKLTGKIEVLEHDQREMAELLKLFRKDAEARLDALERSGKGAAGAVSAVTPSKETVPSQSAGQGSGQGSGTPLKTVVDGDAQAMYDEAVIRIRKNDMSGAEAQLLALAGKFPKDPILGNARFWLGEIAYRKQQYSQAAKYYLDGIQKNPNSPKGPDLWLKLGMSLSNLGNADDACAAFGELETRFKPLPQNIAPRLKAEKQKANCK